MPEHPDSPEGDHPGEATEEPGRPHRPEDMVFSERYRNFWRTLLGGWRRH
jgi:hypothetical protein